MCFLACHNTVHEIADSQKHSGAVLTALGHVVRLCPSHGVLAASPEGPLHRSRVASSRRYVCSAWRIDMVRWMPLASRGPDVPRFLQSDRTRRRALSTSSRRRYAHSQPAPCAHPASAESTPGTQSRPAPPARAQSRVPTCVRTHPTVSQLPLDLPAASCMSVPSVMLGSAAVDRDAWQQDRASRGGWCASYRVRTVTDHNAAGREP